MTTSAERRGPRRTCVGCRVTRPADELVRVARSREGTLGVGRTLPGRGAWLCPSSPGCLEQAIRKGGFARSFRTPLTRSDLDAICEALAPAPGA